MKLKPIKTWFELKSGYIFQKLVSVRDVNILRPFIALIWKQMFEIVDGHTVSGGKDKCWQKLGIRKEFMGFVEFVQYNLNFYLANSCRYKQTLK